MKSENKTSDDFIYHHNGSFTSNPLINRLIHLSMGIASSIGLASFAMLFLIIISMSLFKIEIPMIIFKIGTVIISSIFFYLMLKQELTVKSSYKIYSDRIDFFNEKTPSEVDTIDLEKIDQVRYEDEFGDTRPANAPRQWFIYCYFKNGYQSKSKKIRKDRLMLLLKNDSNKVNNIIKILQFFKEEKKQVYISTNYSEINTALNLKNWTEPDIRLL